ncbi:MAG: alpha/beta hydrolase [Dehalococcoidia bacterium]|nr:alpha/beta hydrolase [Dehalococcoidia bacterium]
MRGYPKVGCFRRLLLPALSIALALLAAAPAAGADGQRYRDEVFDSVLVTSDIAYGEAIDEHGELETLYLDLYEPEGDAATGRPALVWIHGGGFTGGDKADSLHVEIATRFAKRGYVAASINYRLREGEYFEPNDPELPLAIADAQHDAQAAVRWLRANAASYRIDPGRIAVGGSSAGAVTSLYVTYNSSDPGDSGNPGYPSDVSAGVSVSGAMAPLLIEAGEPPAMMVHGVEDTRVPYDLALQVVARAQAVGVTVEFHPLDGIGHGVWTLYKEPVIAWMSDFLYRQVASPPVGGLAEPAALPAECETSVPFAPIAAAAGLGGGLLLAVASVALHKRLFRSS